MKKYLLIATIPAISIGLLLFAFRKGSFVKLLEIDVLGDRALKTVMGTAHFVPEKLIKFNASSSTGIAATWAFRQEYALVTYPIPVVADVNHNGKPEVFISSHSRYVYALDGKTGNMIWDWKLPFGITGGHVVDLADLNSDGKEELIVGTHTSLPIRIYALKTTPDSNKRVLWARTIPGDFFEGGLSIVKQKNMQPLIVAATRDAPYSRGTYEVIKADGTLLFPLVQSVDDCISRPAVGILPGSDQLAVIHGSHDYYKSTFAHRITARDLKTGKILWISKKIGDTGFQNHQIVDLDFDGKNEVLAIADVEKKQHQFILNGSNGNIIKEVPWFIQGVMADRKELLVAQGNKTLCLTADGKQKYAIPLISFGIKNNDNNTDLFTVAYHNDTLTINKYNALSGMLTGEFDGKIVLPDHKNKADFGSIGPPANAAIFLTLADTDNDGNWDCLLQIKDFVVNIKLPIAVRKGANPYSATPYRNMDNGGVIY